MEKSLDYIFGVSQMKDQIQTDFSKQTHGLKDRFPLVFQMSPHLLGLWELLHVNYWTKSTNLFSYREDMTLNL